MNVPQRAPREPPDENGSHTTMVREAPRFSIVSAVYNVARYLDEYISSIDSQIFPASGIQVVVVDDGSTDESLEVLQAWAARRPGVTVLTKENGGQSSARNLGLEHAHGEWVTFLDPDDIVEPDYLSEVDAFLVGHPKTSLVATNRIMLDDATGELTDNHPLRTHFSHGNRLRDINRFTDHFHGSAPSAFFRLERLNELDIRFDPHVRPNFEDGHFCCRYLLAEEVPLVGFVASARYHYRKRRDSTSTLQNSLGDPDRYTKVLRNGYLALLRASALARGAAPEWLQNYVLYELSWYFSSQDAHAGAVSASTGDVADEFHELMAQIVEYLDDDLVLSFTLRPLKRVWKEILLHSYDDEPWHNPFVVLSALDPEQVLVRVAYHFTGELPREQFLCRGDEVAPKHEKVRDIAYHGRTLLKERIVWLSASSTLRIKLDGRDADLRFSAPGFPTHTLRPAMMRSRLDKRRNARVATGRRRSTSGSAAQLTVQDRLALRLADTPPVRRWFRDAWALMDRIHDADDSGERLFQYLRKERRDVNAWFVLEPGTPDWQRMRAEGHRRLVPHGSLMWKLLMLNAQHLVSSHADNPVTRPPDLLKLTRPTWRFTFLQHGVIKDDLSQWLNPKAIDLFITSTQPEYHSIAADHTAYAFTTKETKLTGLPRFDRLRQKGLAVPAEQRDLVLLAPTWRNWLLPPLVAGTQRRSIKPQELMESDFGRNWLGLLRSPELAEACARKGLTIGFLPHPNLQPVLEQLDLPPHVRALNFTDNDVQELFARAAVLVTDYSSMAFNTAYIDRPTVYFQFDSHLVLGGAHVGRRGYFDYERDGFGPVAHDLDTAVRDVLCTLDAGPAPTELYQKRIEATFPLRDGRCCERVATEIERSTRFVPLRDTAAARRKLREVRRAERTSAAARPHVLRRGLRLLSKGPRPAARRVLSELRRG